MNLANGRACDMLRSFPQHRHEELFERAGSKTTTYSEAHMYPVDDWCETYRKLTSMLRTTFACWPELRSKGTGGSPAQLVEPNWSLATPSPQYECASTIHSPGDPPLGQAASTSSVMLGRRRLKSTRGSAPITSELRPDLRVLLR